MTLRLIANTVKAKQLTQKLAAFFVQKRLNCKMVGLLIVVGGIVGGVGEICGSCNT